MISSPEAEGECANGKPPIGIADLGPRLIIASQQLPTMLPLGNSLSA